MHSHNDKNRPSTSDDISPNASKGDIVVNAPSVHHDANGIWRFSKSKSSQVWRPTAEEQTNLDSYHEKIELMTNYVRMAHHRRIYGVFIYGRAGISKTHTVYNYLNKVEGKDWIPVKGKATARGLFDTIEAYPDKTIVLDDVSAIFDDRTGQQLLLSALEAPPSGQTVRTVSYLKADSKQRVPFTGAIIAISNLGLKSHCNKIMAAIKDRCSTFHHNPSNEEVRAFLMQLASQGVNGIKPMECLDVAKFMVDAMKEKGVEDLLTIRLFVQKALAYYQSWKDKIITHDWRDMVRNVLTEVAIKVQHQTQEVRETIHTIMASKKELLRNIILRAPKPGVQLELAKKQLGISRATFFAWKRELISNLNSSEG
jgi:hypothetical protein